MAMITCPQCEGAMSNYAPTCPHCGKLNPAAPQAILRQEQRESLADIPQNIEELSVPVAEVISPGSEAPRIKSEAGLSQWIADLRLEWKGLSPSTQYTIQALFGSAIFVVTGLWFYAIISS